MMFPTVSWSQHFAGTKVIIDKFAYTEKRTWRAVAVVVDKRRPNCKKPIYKKKLFITRTPRAYLVKGVGLIVHPDIYNKIQEQMYKSAMRQADQMIASAFGVPSELIQPTKSITASNLEEMIRKLA